MQWIWLAMWLAACREDESVGARAFYASTFSRTPSAVQLARIGERAFFDASLSRDGALACASCHDPGTAFASDHPGRRAAPSLRYVQAIPRFTEHFVDPDLDTGEDQGPAGGLTWDGHAQSLHDQARSPLFSPTEMATSEPALVRALARSAYADEMREAFGDDVFDRGAVKALLLALEVFQQDPAKFAPYTSKFDRVIARKDTLSPAEARGKLLFDTRAGCARCHPDTGPHPAFSDFGFVALGLPGDDLGLCERIPRDDYCGKFRTPSLRNAASRSRFFHDGSVRSLTEVVRFYLKRDLAQVPARVRANVDREPPFGVQLSEAEIADVVAFIGTLTDADVTMPPARTR